MEWIDRIERDLKNICIGDFEKEPNGGLVCKFKNGEVSANVSPDGSAKMLFIKKNDVDGKKFIRMESYRDDMVITRSLTGKLEFLHKMGQDPEVRVEQKEGPMLGEISVSAYNDKVKTSLTGYF